MDMTVLQNGTADQSSNTWQNDFLLDLLHKSVVSVKFVKKDGTDRIMQCTLKADLLPEQVDLEEVVQKKKSNPEVLAVFDTEKQAWRSFRWDSVIGFSELN